MDGRAVVPRTDQRGTAQSMAMAPCYVLLNSDSTGAETQPARRFFLRSPGMLYRGSAPNKMSAFRRPGIRWGCPGVSSSCAPFLYPSVCPSHRLDKSPSAPCAASGYLTGSLGVRPDQEASSACLAFARSLTRGARADLASPAPPVSPYSESGRIEPCNPFRGSWQSPRSIAVYHAPWACSHKPYTCLLP